MIHNKKAIVCLAAGTSQINIIKKIKKCGYVAIVFDKDANAIGMKFADISFNINLLDIEEIIKKIYQLSEQYKIKGIISRTTGLPLQTASKISQIFELRGIEKTFVDLSLFKLKLAEFCVKNKIKSVYDKMYVENDFKEIKFPVIIKPDYSIISKNNILVCKNWTQMRQFFKGKKISNFIVTPYIDGIDCACYCWMNNGKINEIVWIDEITGVDENRNIVGLGYCVPSIINEKTKTIAKNSIKKIVKNFQKTNILSIFSFRVDFSGIPHLLEIHSDLGDSALEEKLLPESSPDFDYLETAIKISDGTIDSLQKNQFKEIILLKNMKKWFPSKKLDTHIINEGNITENMKVLEKIIQKNKKFLIPPKNLQCMKIYNSK